MIFKINPSFVPRPRLLAPPARLSFYRADMESYEFYSIISSLAAVCERAVILARTKEGRRMPRGKKGVGKGGGVRLFVFATGEPFISNPQSPSVINHN